MSDSTYVPVAHNIIRSGSLSSLKPAETVVWLILKAHCNDQAECWPKHSTIAELSGLGITTVRKAIRRLRDLGVIACRFTGRTNVYAVGDPGSACPSGDTLGCHQADSPGCSLSASQSDSVAQYDHPACASGDILPSTMGTPQRKRNQERETNEPPLGPGDSWMLVGSRLQQLGLTAWRSTVSQARCSGLSPSQALEVIAAYDPARWSAGALAWRLRNGSPDMAASDGWPTPRESDRPRPKRFPQFEVWRATQIKRLGPGVTIDDELEQRLQAAYDLARSHYLTPTTG